MVSTKAHFHETRWALPPKNQHKRVPRNIVGDAPAELGAAALCKRQRQKQRLSAPNQLLDPAGLLGDSIEYAFQTP